MLNARLYVRFSMLLMYEYFIKVSPITATLIRVTRDIKPLKQYIQIHKKILRLQINLKLYTNKMIHLTKRQNNTYTTNHITTITN